jgi:Ca2+-binding EF-hand superfamily protein
VLDGRHIFNNKKTTNNVGDAEAAFKQMQILLSKKRELVLAGIEEKKRAGLQPEQIQEIADNFAFFDKNKSGSLDKKELRQCLASLGEDSTPSDVDKILAQYDANKNGKISKDEFTECMKTRVGDTNTREEVVAGFKLIVLDDEKRCFVSLLHFFFFFFFLIFCISVWCWSLRCVCW